MYQHFEVIISGCYFEESSTSKRSRRPTTSTTRSQSRAVLLTSRTRLRTSVPVDFNVDFLPHVLGPSPIAIPGSPRLVLCLGARLCFDWRLVRLRPCFHLFDVLYRFDGALVQWTRCGVCLGVALPPSLSSASREDGPVAWSMFCATVLASHFPLSPSGVFLTFSFRVLKFR